MTTRALDYLNRPLEIEDIYGLTLVWPLKEVRITQEFANILNPDRGFRHFGIDFGCYLDPVSPIGSGTVTTVQTEDKGDYGKHVFVEHWWGSSLYAHLDVVYVTPGQHVGPGTILGLSGNTGYSTAAHLHCEARVKNTATRFEWMDYVGREWRKTDEEWYMSLTDEQRQALVEMADLYIDGKGFFPGSPGRSVLIQMMDTYKALTPEGRDRFAKRLPRMMGVMSMTDEELKKIPQAAALLRTWGLDLIEIGDRPFTSAGSPATFLPPEE